MLLVEVEVNHCEVHVKRGGEEASAQNRNVLIYPRSRTPGFWPKSLSRYTIMVTRLHRSMLTEKTLSHELVCNSGAEPVNEA